MGAIPGTVDPNEDYEAMMVSKKIQLEATAIHEAAHAVIGIILGMTVRSVIMVGEEGYCYIDRNPEISDAEDAEKLIMVALAGQWAQWRYRAVTCKTSDWNIDENLVRDHIRKICEGRKVPQSLNEQLLLLREHPNDPIARMQIEVEKNKHRIMRVGAELLNADNQTLLGSRVTEIMLTKDGPFLEDLDSDSWTLQ